MNKETVSLKLHQLMIERASRKIESGKNDFTAYPLLGKIAIGLIVGIGEKSDSFYNEVNEAIVANVPSQVYAIRSDIGSGESDSVNRVHVGSDPIVVRAGEEVQVRASSPRTQSE